MSGQRADCGDGGPACAQRNIRPMIETVPLENAPEAYARMMRGEARFRIVLLTAADTIAQHDSS